MPSYTFDLASREGDTIAVEADRESVAISRALGRRRFADDHQRWRLITRRMDLTEGLALSRADALADLNDAGYYRR